MSLVACLSIFSARNEEKNKKGAEYIPLSSQSHASLKINKNESSGGSRRSLFKSHKFKGFKRNKETLKIITHFRSSEKKLFDFY